MLTRYLIVLLVIAGALVTAVAHKESAPREWPQSAETKTIKFSHTFHVKESGIACEDCHPGAKSSKLSSDNLRSNHDNCTACHEQQINEQCGYCHRDAENPQAVPAPARDIIFAHEQHVARGVECVTCHPGLEEVEYAGPGNMPVMGTCNTCHNDAQVTNACEACHVSFTNLIPSDHLVSNFNRVHKQWSRLGALEVECGVCHTQDFCAQCHSAPLTLQFGRGARMADPAPRVSPSNTPKQMTLQMAHDLNYRFTHGVDAKSTTADCYSCHSPQQFCSDCHLTGDNITGGGFTPAWHLGAGFTTLGRGSGGGRHAEFARRDIENCVACHDAQGGDPTCLGCHFDADGIRGTDPKTHPAGYMEGEEGSWHTDRGATCYTCHTDFNARPDGVKGRAFCGYCHG